MNILSLFNGLGGAQLTLDRLGVKPSKVYVSEIDKFAIKESQANHPDNIHLGDVTNWRNWNIDWASIDFLCAGSPCQGFSSAGKQGGTKAKLDGEIIICDTLAKYHELKAAGAEFMSQSHLFWVFIEILEHIKALNPNLYFFLENVKMSANNLEMIDRAMSSGKIFINSALVCAQNRQRWYWCNWKTSQPEDRGIYLRDILEDIPTNPTYMSDKFVNRQKGQRCLVDDFDRKASSLSAGEYVKNGRQGDYIRVNPAAMVGRKINPETGKRDDYNPNIETQQYLEVHDHGKARCLSTVAKDTLVSTLEPGRYAVSDLNVKFATARRDQNGVRRLADKSDKSTALTARYYKGVCSDGAPFLYTGDKKKGDEFDFNLDKLFYRKLTVIECCRLQGVPDDFFKVSSNTQAYKMLGNGWQIDTIKHIWKDCPLFIPFLRVAS